MSEQATRASAVFYIDGSCRPHNPGFIGWGIHGYLYQGTPEKPVVNEQNVHTSHGYYPLSKEIQPYVQKVTPIEYVDGYGSHAMLLTNNVAEILAFLNLLQGIMDKNLETVRVYTDSEYLKTCMNDYCKRWERNNWIRHDQTPVSNREFLEPTYNLLKELRAKGTDITIHWVRSHNGDLGNERADLLAGIGGAYSQARDVKNVFEYYPVRKFWECDADRDPYIAFRRMYFNSVAQYNRPGIYHLAESSDPEFVLGKPASDTGYSVIRLLKPDPIIEQVRQKQFEHSRGMNAIMQLKLDALYSKHVYPWIEKHGGLCLTGPKNTHSVSMVNKVAVTIERNPTGLAMHALDHFALLEELLNLYIDHQTGPVDKPLLFAGCPTEFINITSSLFGDVPDKKNKDKTKKELLTHLVVGYKNMVLDVEITVKGKQHPVKIPYALGFDCLPRNNLKRIEDSNPYVVLITWQNGTILRYATIIQSDHGIGIWSNFFANQVLLPP